MQYKMRVLNSLAKVFPDELTDGFECERVTALHGERVSFQVAYYSEQEYITRGKFKLESDFSKNISLRSVECVPSLYPCHINNDENYIRKAPGLYPDLLRSLHNDTVFMPAHQWHSVWIEIDVDDSILAGKHKLSFSITSEDGKEVLCESSVDFVVYDTILEPQALIHTEWFHSDCLAEHYNVPAWSERHWEIVEEFIKTASERGINMILTPIHTPPLDTAEGGERPTVQLVDINVNDGKYSFGFDKLKRWVDVCIRCGIKYFEMAHLFTQWGSAYAPKIMATVDGCYKRIFGWDTKAVGGEYSAFLNEYIPAITQRLEEWEIADKAYFHISDEPSMENIDGYRSALNSVEHLIRGYKRLDALSDYEFYKQGLVPLPVPANDHNEAFIDANIEGLWTYYCTAQCREVSNRFMDMPSARNRAIGVQMYLYNISGFLHWGYNFYYTQHSIMKVNPYCVTDAGGAFPSGDPFLVYPSESGKPEESIRLIVFYNAISDLRAFHQLEKKKGRKYVEALINEGLTEPITFKKYPIDNKYYINLRDKVNIELAADA